MMRRLVSMLCLVVAAQAAPAQEVNADLELATKAAVKKVAPSVVQIVTQGGIDLVVPSPKGPTFRKALGPTTGLILTADGYIISSAFNFINQPTTILVAVQGHPEAYVAKRVATDKSRLLTLLKIDAQGLPVPTFVPKADIRVGQWAIALGRALDTKRLAAPSVSVGIISATGRIWGKAIQTDAKVSPLNYGGPLIDITGRVQGVLIPASPRGDDETAGFEWYDSGIGFAIPLEDVYKVLPRLKEGKDLQRGLLGVRMKSQDIYSVVPEVGEVLKDSAAAKVGLQKGDIITEVDGKPVVRMAQIQHILGPKYDGDKISLKFRRGNEEKVINELTLVAQLQSPAHPFLGILPLRDDPELGVEIRYVFPKSPAERAGLKPGDRIVKHGLDKALIPFSGAQRGTRQLSDWLNTLVPGMEVKLEVKRKDGDKTETVALTLDQLPGSDPAHDFQLPDEVPGAASAKKALAPLKVANPKVQPPKVEPPAGKPETGIVKRATADGEHKFQVYVPEDYDPNIAHALVVWLHPPGKNKDDDFEAFAALWEEHCARHHLILVMPISENESGWLRGESDFVLEAVQDTMKRYTIDPRRVVAHGLGIGGQMALHLGMNHRDVFTGVAAVGAVVGTIKDNVPTQRLAFFLAAGSQDPLAKSVADSRVKLADKKYSAYYLEMANRGREYLEESHLRQLVRWIDTLDKQ
ncbi:MAG: PDZ domain-containing protein [Gemmataceae bacterium]|nr:PDZ domain-containing protein [Gemmataceae bacterium]